MESLVIVESPAKAKTINKILGKEYGVKASIGHVKDLPAKELGVDIEKNFAPTYVIIPGKEKIVKELKNAAKKTDKIYIATDPDREGEAIAYHIAEEVASRKDPKKVYRVTFHEITERAVKEAMAHPGEIDMNKVDAQQARRILDRLVGYKLSPFLWQKVRRGLSAGRVQSVAVRLVAEREKEIESFKKEEYWTVEATVQPHEAEAVGQLPQFAANLYKYRETLVINRDAKEGERFLIGNSDSAERVIKDLGNKTFYLEKIEKKLRKRSPAAPFITSTLQQESARRLKFPAKKTMSVAQKLYEGIELGEEGSVGLITYMRSDSYTVAGEAQKWARELISGRFGKDFLPEKPPVYRNKATAQEAHEAIRPTYPEKTPEKVKPFLSRDQYHLYSLIWNRFIASQMCSAQLEQTTFIIGLHDSGTVLQGTEFRVSGTVIKFPGFMALYSEGKDDIEEEEGGILPSLKEGDLLDRLDIKPIQHFTQPPPRYSEATLVKALEEKGIGRPSTYATILSTIQDRKYVQRMEGRFAPTELGVVVNDLLVEKFPELLDIGFTAKMETELDEIENADMKWVTVIKDFYTPFSRSLTEASNDMAKVKPQDLPTDTICEKCGKPMVIRWGRHGRFLACTGFPKCKNAKPLNGENGAKNVDQVFTDEVCEKCGARMVIKIGRFGKFLACSNYPECKSTRPLSTGVKCPLDDGDIVERKSKRGKSFWSCSNYPNCKFAMWYKPVPKPCPSCHVSFLVEKMNKMGEIFHVCVNKGCGHKEKVEMPEETQPITA